MLNIITEPEKDSVLGSYIGVKYNYWLIGCVKDEMVMDREEDK